MLKTFWRNFGFKGILPILVFLASLILIIAIHVGAFYGYLSIAEKNRDLHRTNYLRHVLAETQLLESLDTAKLILLVKQPRNDNHLLSISDVPQYALHLQDMNYNRLDQLISQHTGKTQFSIQIKNGKWLNYQVQLAPMYTMTFITLLLSQLLQVMIMFGLVWYVWRFNHFSPLLNNFRKTAEQLGIDPQATPLKVRGFSQVRAVANVMNQLQQRILDLVDRRNQLLASISHDLKTPITRLQLQLSLIKDQVYAKEMEGELDEMNMLLNQLMYFAQVDPINEKKINLDLVSLLQTICDRAVSMGHNVEFTTDLNRAVFFGRSLSLKRAFTNIVDNGIKYGTNVRVCLEKKDGHYFVIIDDDGDGIDPEEVVKVFQPFYRSKNTAHSKPGSGLGLAIVQEAIQAHQGKITLTNRPPKGLRVTVFL